MSSDIDKMQIITKLIIFVWLWKKLTQSSLSPPYILIIIKKTQQKTKQKPTFSQAFISVRIVNRWCVFHFPCTQCWNAKL